MNPSEDHQLALQHSLAIQYSDQVDLEKRRSRNKLRLKGQFESIFKKYEKDFTSIGDEIDLESCRVVVDNGHLDVMEHDLDVGLPDALHLEADNQASLTILGDRELEAELDGQLNVATIFSHIAKCNSHYPSPSKVQAPVRDPYFMMDSVPIPSPKSISHQTNTMAYDSAMIQQICRTVTASVMEAMTKNPYSALSPAEPAWQAPPLPKLSMGHSYSPFISRKSSASPPAVRQTSLRLRWPRGINPSRTEESRPVSKRQSIWAIPDRAYSSSESRSPSPSLGDHPFASYRSSHNRSMQNHGLSNTSRHKLEHHKQSKILHRVSATDSDDDGEDDSAHGSASTDRHLHNSDRDGSLGRLSAASSPNTERSSGRSLVEEQDAYDSEIPISGRYIDSWTDEDEELLMKLRETDGLNWRSIRKYFPSRSHDSIVSHWKAIRRRCPGHRRLHLQPEMQTDDSRPSIGLTSYKLVIPRNDENYEPCPKKRDFPRRSWSLEDQILLIKLKELDQRSWDTILNHFPSRSRDSVKSRWKSIIYTRPTFLAQLMERAQKLHQQEKEGSNQSRFRTQSIGSTPKSNSDNEMEDMQANHHTQSKEGPWRIGPQEQPDIDQNRHPFNIELTKAPPSVRPHCGPGRVKLYTREDDELLVQLRKSHNLRWKECVDYFPPRTIDSLFARWKRLTQWYNGEKDAPQPYSHIMDRSSFDSLETNEPEMLRTGNRSLHESDTPRPSAPLAVADNQMNRSRLTSEVKAGSDREAADDLIDPLLKVTDIGADSTAFGQIFQTTGSTSEQAERVTEKDWRSALHEDLEPKFVSEIPDEILITNETNPEVGCSSMCADNHDEEECVPAKRFDMKTHGSPRPRSSGPTCSLAGMNTKPTILDNAQQTDNTQIVRTKKRKSSHELERVFKQPTSKKFKNNSQCLDKVVSKRLAPPQSKRMEKPTSMNPEVAKQDVEKPAVFPLGENLSAGVIGTSTRLSSKSPLEMSFSDKPQMHGKDRGRLSRESYLETPKERAHADAFSASRVLVKKDLTAQECMDDVDELA